MPQALHIHLRYYFIALSLLAFVLILPMLTAYLPTPLRLLVMKSYQLLCHQIEARSFHVDHIPFAICHRCTGIYSGILSAALLFLWTKRHDAKWMLRAKWWILLASFPILADVGLEWLQWRDNTTQSRWGSGFVFGIIVGYYPIRGITFLIQEMFYPNQNSIP